MATMRRVQELLELSWPVVAGGGLENEVRRAAWRDAWEVLRELGILSARVVGLRCPDCGGLRTVPDATSCELDENGDPEPTSVELETCPTCKGQPLATLVEKRAWEAAVCRSAGLNLAFQTKEDARAYYGNAARCNSPEFERWWSGLESRLVPVASALLVGQVLPANSLGRLRYDGSTADPGQRRFRFVTGRDGEQPLELEQLTGKTLAVIGLDGTE